MERLRVRPSQLTIEGIGGFLGGYRHLEWQITSYVTALLAAAASRAPRTLAGGRAYMPDKEDNGARTSPMRLAVANGRTGQGKSFWAATSRASNRANIVSDRSSESLYVPPWAVQ